MSTKRELCWGFPGIGEIRTIVRANLETLADASVELRVSRTPGMGGSEATGEKSTGDHSPRSKGVRRALKNARSLVAELFARERQGTGTRLRRFFESNQDPRVAERSTPPGNTSHQGSEPPQDGSAIDNKEDPGDEENHSFGYNTVGNNARGTRGHKTALDTLSTIDEDDWDVLDGENDLLKTFDDQAAMVQPGLFIGAFLAEQNKEELEKKGITHILQVGDNLTQSFEGEFQYRTICVADTEAANLLVFFRDCFDFIEDAKGSGGGVLVHCFAGISRSATICISYLMWKQSLSLGAAHFMVESARPCTQPNDGFKVQLQTFESLGCDLERLEHWNASQRPANAFRELSSDEFDL